VRGDAVKLNKVFLVLALAAVVMCVSGEIGGGVWLAKSSPPADGGWSSDSDVRGGGNPITRDKVKKAQTAIAKDVGPEKLKRPGVAIPYLALLDILLLVTYGFIAASILLPERAIAPLHAGTSLIVSLLVVIASFIGLFVTIGLTMAMIGLLLAVPFGTIAYLALWGSFPVGTAAATLGVLLFLKLAFGVCVLLAQPKFIENKVLVFLVGSSILVNLIVAFLHGFPPGILASITDAIGGIVVAVFAIVWGIVILVRAVIAIVRLLMSVGLAPT
jgi:hypothetical protein